MSHDFHERNRRSWNAVTAAHNSHKRDQAAFLRDGGSTLFDDELELLGDIEGKRLVHLQCNCGQDSLSLARLGAEVTGVDIADEPIAFARQLARDTGIDATFEQADVLEWFDAADRTFDIAFSTYGTIGWIADLGAWARGVRSILAPGGKLVLLEFHPLVWSLDARGQLTKPYFIDGPIEEDEGVTDYVAASGDGLTPMGSEAGVTDFENPHPCVSFQWTVAQTVQAIVDAGLRLTVLREYPYSNGCRMPGMRDLGDDRFGMPEGRPDLPLMLGITATN